jgi:hypothetical protein
VTIEDVAFKTTKKADLSVRLVSLRWMSGLMCPEN